MIIGVDATNRCIQYAAVSDTGVQAHEWDGIGVIETLPTRIQALLSETDSLRGALIILGPGSYTGIRLSLTTLKVLTLVHDVPLMGVSLFDAYMTINHHLLQGLTLLPSPSRKGVFNAQLFQSSQDGFSGLSSLLQLNQNELRRFLARFDVPIYWHHLGDDSFLFDEGHVRPQSVGLNLLALIRHHRHRIVSMDEAPSLSPIYSYPPVMK